MRLISQLFFKVITIPVIKVNILPEKYKKTNINLFNIINRPNLEK